MSEVFAAIAPVAGSIGGYETSESELFYPQTPSSQLPVMIIHGTADTHVAFEGGHAILASGSRIDLSVQDAVSFWVESNGAEELSNESSESLVLTKYVGENTTSDVFVYVIINGLHVWPGESTDLLQILDASEIIWSFFENHTRT